MNQNEVVNSEESYQEYETQYFGFTPSTAVDEVFNINLSYVEDGFRTTCKVLAVKHPDIAWSVIEKAAEGLCDDILKSLDKMCNKLEIYLLNNILCIPDNFVLPEDSVQQDQSLKAIDESQLDNDIRRLKSSISNEIKTAMQLHAEKQRLELLVTNYQKTIDCLNEMEKVLSDAGVESLQEAITTSSTKATKLLKVLKSLESDDDH